MANGKNGKDPLDAALDAVNKGGRPKIEIDREQFEKLCGLQATQEEIAGWFHCSHDTIQARCIEWYGEGFSVVLKKVGVSGKISLRRLQYQKAQEGNTSMLIWLGKQWLNQQDTIPPDTSNQQGQIISEIDDMVQRADLKGGNNGKKKKANGSGKKNGKSNGSKGNGSTKKKNCKNGKKPTVKKTAKKSKPVSRKVVKKKKVSKVKKKKTKSLDVPV